MAESLRIPDRSLGNVQHEAQSADLPSFDSRGQLFLEYLIRPQLIPKRQPPIYTNETKRLHLNNHQLQDSPWSSIMLPPKYLDLPPTGAHPLDQAIHLLGLPARLAHLGHDHVGVEAPVGPGGELEVARVVGDGLHPDEHVLFGVVEPVACAPRADDALKLLGDGSALGCLWREREGGSVPGWSSPRPLRLRGCSPRRVDILGLLPWLGL